MWCQLSMTSPEWKTTETWKQHKNKGKWLPTSMTIETKPSILVQQNKICDHPIEQSEKKEQHPYKRATHTSSNMKPQNRTKHIDIQKRWTNVIPNPAAHLKLKTTKVLRHPHPRKHKHQPPHNMNSKTPASQQNTHSPGQSQIFGKEKISSSV